MVEYIKKVMYVKFTKMHGSGNDFIIIENSINIDYSKTAKKICNRRFSIGADGLMIIESKDNNSVYMRYYNSDGSVGEMCGNGARCLALFAYNNNYIKNNSFTIYTINNKVNAEIIDENQVKIDIGKVQYETDFENYFLEKEIVVEDKIFKGSYVSMGVPHVVIVVDKLELSLLLEYGPKIEKLPIFKHGTNVNFVQIIDKNNLNIDTWERGVGKTLACGTGASAAGYCLNKLGKVSNEVQINAPGGILMVSIDDKEHVYLQGPAIKTFEGTIEEDLDDY